MIRKKGGEKEGKNSDIVEQIKASAHRSTSSPWGQGEVPQLYIPTGSMLLNLCCSDSIWGGYGTGKMVNLIGDSSSGKTLLALTMLAEMAYSKEFSEYRLIYDDVECALEFDVEMLFGKKLARRLEPPPGSTEDKPYSDTIQDFQYHMEQALRSRKPFVYVLDSFDALTSVEERERTEKYLEAYRKGKDPGGSYRVEKPKVASEILRQVVGGLRDTRSLLLIISQTRDNLDALSFQRKTRSGGNALRFYAAHEIWLAVAGKIKRKDRVVGVRVKAKVTKNKLTGKLRECEFNIYYDYGVDAVGECVDFLINEGHWKKTKLTVEAPELGLQGTRDSLIRQIEDRGLENKLFEVTQAQWLSIEESIRLDRKPRFGGRDDGDDND